MISKETQREKIVAKLLQEVKERRELGKKYREYLLKCSKEDVEYLRVWIRSPVIENEKKQNKHIVFWN